MSSSIGSDIGVADIDNTPFAGATPTSFLWVSATAGAGGDGSKEKPFQSIQSAVSAATAGTAIMVQAGTYVENVKLPTKSTATVDSPIWLVSADGPQAAKIYAADQSKSTIYGYGTDNMVIKNFEIHGGYNGIQVSQSGSNFINTVHNIVIQGNVIFDSVEDGIKVSQANQVYVLDNTVVGTGEEGIDLVATNNSVVARNDISGAAGAAGIFAKGGSTNVTIAENYVHGTVKDGILIGGWTEDAFFAPGYTGYEAKNISVIGNWVEDVGRRPLNVLGGVDSVATGNYLEANPKYATAIEIGTGNPKAAVVVVSSNIDISGNVITDAKKLLIIDAGNNNNISMHDNATTGTPPTDLGPNQVALWDQPSDGVEAGPLPTDGDDGQLGQIPAETAGGSVIDEIVSSLSYTLADTIKNLTLVSAAGAGLTGIGNALDNHMKGGDGSDTLDGGAGADTLAGGLGDDIYIVESAGDVVTELAGQGVDTVRSSLSYTLGANVENLTLTGDLVIDGVGNDLNNVLIGNMAANTLQGGAGNDWLNGGLGADTLVGGAGDDTYVIDGLDTVTELAGEGLDTVRASLSYTLGKNVENLTLTGDSAIDGSGNELDNVLVGNGASNTLRGGAGADLLDGGAGADTLIGGVGDDTYVVDNAGDVVTEAANAGADTVQTSLGSYTLGANVENLTHIGPDDFNGTGNSGANLIIGGSGADVLDGKGGADTLIGGLGDDTYVIDNVGDQVFELAGGGVDTIRASVSFALGDHVENLILFNSGAINGVGNGLDNTITGNAGANVIDGGAGADLLTGGKGNDTFVFHAGQAQGDTVFDFTGAGATVGDHLEFVGFGAGTLTRIGTTDGYLITPDALHGGAAAAEVIHLNGVFNLDLQQGGAHNDILFA
jgi:Ca2+-binding RTX toxin-like protein